MIRTNKYLIVMIFLALLVSLVAKPTGSSSAAGTAFTENWTAASSSFLNLMDMTGGSGNAATSNVADTGASDGKALRFTLNAGSLAGPEEGANAKSPILYGYGTYKTRLKTTNCSNQPNAGIISGFFTYFNDGRDTNANGLADNSEIDFEWLCAQPEVVLLTVWTDYHPSTEEHRRIYREVNLATGTIIRTCYGTVWGQCTAPMTGENQPASIPAIPGYNSSTAYYEYGFTWLPGHITWWMIHPTTGAQITLWDYVDPYAGTNNARVPSLEAYYMINAWHHAAWTPSTCCASATQAPSSVKYMYVDWAQYTPQGAATSTPTKTNTPVAPTATPSNTAVATGNLALNKAVTGSIAIQNAAYVTNGDKNTANYAGQEVGAQWVQIDLGQSYNVSQVNLWHYFADGRTYRDVIVQVSNDPGFATKTTVFNNDTNNSAGQGTGAQAEYAETSNGKTITFTPVNARYVRLWSNGSSANGYNHYVEAEVYASGVAPSATPTKTNTPIVPTATPTKTNTPVPPTATIAPTVNLALNKAVTGSIAIQNPTFITNGDKNTANYAGQEVGAQWIQIDLGQSYNVSKVNLWHYFADGRTYRDVIVQVSNDPSFATKTTVFNNDTNNSAGQGTGAQTEYAETSTGKTITFAPVSARYVRIWSNGSSANGYNHYVEVEVFAGSGASATNNTTAYTNQPVAHKVSLVDLHAKPGREIA